MAMLRTTRSIFRPPYFSNNYSLLTSSWWDRTRNTILATTPSNHTTCTSRSPRSNNIYDSLSFLPSYQKRCYIFFPSSISEFIRIVRDTITSDAPVPSKNSTRPTNWNSSNTSSSTRDIQRQQQGPGQHVMIRLRRSRHEVYERIKRILTTQFMSPKRIRLGRPTTIITPVSTIPSSLNLYNRTRLKFSQWKLTKKQPFRDWMVYTLNRRKGITLRWKQKAQNHMVVWNNIQQMIRTKWNKSVKTTRQRLEEDPERIIAWSSSPIQQYRLKLATSFRQFLHTGQAISSSTRDPSCRINMYSSHPKRKQIPILRILFSSNAKHFLYSQKKVVMTEPFDPSWFDVDGYPLTSQDPQTLRFVNPWNSSSTNGWKTLRDVYKWKMNRTLDLNTTTSTISTASSSQSNNGASLDGENSPIPTPIPKSMMDISSPSSSEIKIKLTWIGHSTCLIHFSNQFTILTDPIFSNKASPFQFFEKSEFVGVPRYSPPALNIDDLPEKIDVCLISHDHYDHLDYRSVQALVPRVQFWVVPLGIKQWLLDNIHGMDPQKIVDLKWWDHVILQRPKNKNKNDWGHKNELTLVSTFAHEPMKKSQLEQAIHNDDDCHRMVITCAPAQHWCSRTPFDRNKRLWCSWAVHAWISQGLESKEETQQFSHRPLAFFFAGDTARPETFPLHRQIGDRLGPFDLAAIPIGAYEPRFFMRDSHCDPYEAVQIHNDLRCKKSVAIHWGTFPLANESYGEPPILLKEAVNKLELEMNTATGDELSLHQKMQGKIDFVAIGHGDSMESQDMAKDFMVRDVLQ